MFELLSDALGFESLHLHLFWSLHEGSIQWLWHILSIPGWILQFGRILLLVRDVSKICIAFKLSLCEGVLRKFLQCLRSALIGFSWFLGFVTWIVVFFLPVVEFLLKLLIACISWLTIIFSIPWIALLANKSKQISSLQLFSLRFPSHYPPSSQFQTAPCWCCHLAGYSMHLKAFRVR